MRGEVCGLDIFGSGWRYLATDMHVYDTKKTSCKTYISTLFYVMSFPAFRLPFER
jgi:hypothetical protein